MLHYFARDEHGNQIEIGAPPLRERARAALAAKHARKAAEAAEQTARQAAGLRKRLSPMGRAVQAAYERGLRDAMRARVG